MTPAFRAWIWGLALLGAASLSPAASTILFVDDEDVLYRPGTIREVVQATKYSTDPVIKPTEPWEGMLGWTSVYRDPASGKFQLWYQAYQQRRHEDARLRSVVCYAESLDGRNWIKRDLGLFPFYEQADTNIVMIGNGGFGQRYGNTVLFDTREADAGKRYKMIQYDWATGEDADQGGGLFVAFSPDGIRWTKHGAMVSKTSYGGKGEQAPFAGEAVLKETRKGSDIRRAWRLPQTMSDGIDVFYDERSAAYVAYGKMWLPGPDGGMAWRHGMGRIESKDFINWSPPEVVLTTNDRDPPQLEFHTSPVFPYNGMYLSLNQVMDRARGIIDVELMSSRDGRRWNRDFANIPVIKRGEGAVFDAGSIMTNGSPVITEDEMLFYYGAYRGSATGGGGLNRQFVGSDDFFSGVGLATLRLNRFVGVKPNPAVLSAVGRGQGNALPNTLGNVTLRPRDMTGVRRILINGDARAGAITVELLDAAGFRIKGFHRDASVRLAADGVRLEVGWEGVALSDLPAGKYMTRIYLDNSTLYAVTFE